MDSLREINIQLQICIVRNKRTIYNDEPHVSSKAITKLADCQKIREMALLDVIMCMVTAYFLLN